MDCTTDIYAKISNLITDQFPAIYQDKGPVFVAFVKAYYEWLEEDSNTLNKSRNLFNYRDIDKTLDDFLVHFQRKYLYGVPFDVIINKRLLLKHVFDVYRSKSSLQCFELLFRLIYNEDMNVYLPGNDVLRASDGTWKEQRYLEVTIRDANADYVGKKIIGIVSGTTAIIESYITEPINENIIASFYISNISPRNAGFTRGEKIVLFDDYEGSGYADAVKAAPIIIGSLQTLNIVNGGQNFAVGDIVKVVQRSLVNNDIITFGRDGLLRITEVGRGRNSLIFDILDGGFGAMSNSYTWVYNDPTDLLGNGASFDVQSIANARELSWNTDLICDYLDTAIGASTSTFTTSDDTTLKSDSTLVTVDSTDGDTYDFPTNPDANVTTPLDQTFAWSNAFFGSVASLTNINPGLNYQANGVCFVRTPEFSEDGPGFITYSPSSKTISGFDTRFDRYFQNNFVIEMKADGTTATLERHVVKSVTNSTSLEIHGFPAHTALANATYKTGPDILPAQFATYESAFDDYAHAYANVSGVPSIGEGVVQSAVAIDSGRGYVEGEFVELYLSGGINIPTVENGGTGYANGEALVFVGGSPLTQPVGTIGTYANGTISSVVITNTGSGFLENPTITVDTAAGSGAVITTTLNEFNTAFQLSGLVQKDAIGKKRGYWSTNRSLLNSDKYIQDSFFYQDFSYQIETALTLDKYSDILYDTFHIASTELFGKFHLLTENTQLFSVDYSNTAAELRYSDYVFCDNTVLRCDSANTTVDSFKQWATVDRTIITSDSLIPTVDFVEA